MIRNLFARTSPGKRVPGLVLGADLTGTAGAQQPRQPQQQPADQSGNFMGGS